jgi:ATP-binding cassette subfamily B protein
VVKLGIWLIVIDPFVIDLVGYPIPIEPISIGQFTVLLSYYGIITGATTSIINHVPAVTGAIDAIQSLSRLYRSEDEAQSGDKQLPHCHGKITLAGVSFSYPGNENLILRNINLHIPAGTSVALVGPSGGGKSTIASLILGFYRPDHGHIFIDDIDMNELNLSSFRSRVGVVSQDVVLFNDTILANIGWGDHNPNVDRAREAARIANALEFIDTLPGGMLHVLGDRGLGLSGGQRQRIAIARALYRNPHILVLDEATSALDPTSEKVVQQALDPARRGRTTLIIAHRHSTVRHADRVAVIEKGSVSEYGTHQELVQRNGTYASLIAASTDSTRCVSL